MKVPSFSDPVLTQYLSDLAKEQDDNDKNFLTKNTANHSVLIQSPNNSVYEIVVDDTGEVDTNLVSFVIPPTVIPPNAMAAVEAPDRAAFFGATPNAVGLPWNYLTNLEFSTAGSSITFSMAAGVAADRTNSKFMRLASSLNKTTAAWAVGTGVGGLDTGAVTANTWYHAHLIERPDTGAVDVCFSLSAVAPTIGVNIPAAYTFSRRIFGLRTNASSQWMKVWQKNDEFLWDVPILDLSGVAVTSAVSNGTLSVPTGLIVNALFSAELVTTTANATAVTIWCPDFTAPGSGQAQALFAFGTGNAASSYFNVRTNTSAQISMRTGTQSATMTINTQGWIDTRGK